MCQNYSPKLCHELLLTLHLIFQVWLVFEGATGEKYVIEFTGSETISEVRSLLHSGFRQFSLSDRDLCLDAIPGIGDMTEKTLEVVGYCGARQEARNDSRKQMAAFQPSPRRQVPSEIIDIIPETIHLMPPMRPQSPEFSGQERAAPAPAPASTPH